MQAIIMAAGKGSRIEELTQGHPKSFLEINGKKLIQRNIDMLRSNGINDIIIVTGYHDHEFEELYGTEPGVRLIYNPFYEMMNVIGSFFMGMDTLTEDFLYLHADTICEESIVSDLISDRESDILLPVDTKPCDEEAMKVRMLDGKLVQLTKQMPLQDAIGEFIGIARFKKNTLDALKIETKQLMREKIFSEYFEAAVQRLIDRYSFDIRMLDITGRFWAEIDFKEDYERANGFCR